MMTHDYYDSWDGMAKFWTFGNIRQIRRKYQKLRALLQKAKKLKDVL